LQIPTSWVKFLVNKFEIGLHLPAGRLESLAVKVGITIPTSEINKFEIRLHLPAGRLESLAVKVGITNPDQLGGACR